MINPNREQILKVIRRATKARGQGNPDAVRKRLTATRANIVPHRGRPDNKIMKETFIDEAQAAGAQVSCLSALGGVPVTLAGYLQQHGQNGLVRIGSDPLLSAIPWQAESFLTVQSGPATGTDQTGLNLALAGIAETGTVLMASSPQSPAMVNLLPLSHIVLLPASRLVGNYEQTIELIGDNMPRMATYITGPSRTADIEQKLLMGAHGPQRLFILLIDSL